MYLGDDNKLPPIPLFANGAVDGAGVFRKPGEGPSQQARVPDQVGNQAPVFQWPAFLDQELLPGVPVKYAMGGIGFLILLAALKR